MGFCVVSDNNVLGSPQKRLLVIRKSPRLQSMKTGALRDIRATPAKHVLKSHKRFHGIESVKSVNRQTRQMIPSWAGSKTCE